MLEQPELAVGPAVIAQRGAAGLDRVLEHGLDGIDEFFRAFGRRARLDRDRGRPPPGRKPRPVQRLADINVAETGDDLLIQERGLERRLLALAGARQHRSVEFVAERLGPKRAQQRLPVELGARDELHHAEAARIVEGDPRAGRHVEHHVVVRGVLRAIVVIAAGRALVAHVLAFPRDTKRA